MRLKVTLSITLLALLLASGAPATRAQSGSIYLPLVLRNFNPAAGLRTVNAPPTTDWKQMAILWFGRVTASENYTDVRVGYDAANLVLHITNFDRLLWCDTTPTAGDLTNWDSVSVYLNLSGNSGAAPSTSSYRFEVQLSGFPCDSGSYQAAYRGNGSGWAAFGGAFSAATSYRYEDGNTGGTNNGENNRGWLAVVTIPFSSLGLGGAPAAGTVWGLAVVNHDRESAGGPSMADKLWPETADGNVPSSWGRLRFGLPGWTPPSVNNPQTITIRHGLNGAVVPDANIGGHINALCIGDPNYIWNAWGNANNYTETGANVQNQGDLADWPCFAKYYVTFPLTQLPAGRIIRSATLKLHHTQNTGSLTDARPSYIHILRVNENWTDSTITWNNAPLALENVAVATVPVLPGCDYGNPQPCQWRTWDVSRAVAEAYAGGATALRLAVYSSDTDYHSGKIFGTSEQNDYYAVSRPTLEVQLGTP
jgi:hypothetical protein